MANLIIERVELARRGQNPYVICRMASGWLVVGDVFSGHRGKFLQLHLTIEDAGAFTTPWTATLTYVPAPSSCGK